MWRVYVCCCIAEFLLVRFVSFLKRMRGIFRCKDVMFSVVVDEIFENMFWNCNAVFSKLEVLNLKTKINPGYHRTSKEENLKI